MLCPQTECVTQSTDGESIRKVALYLTGDFFTALRKAIMCIYIQT